VGPLNPWNDPAVVYLRALVGCRIDRLRNEPERSKGASAIEWAIITAILAVIAITIGATIRNLIVNKANSIRTE
jgi:Flp pilus assembly pilin Flp